MQVNVFSQEMQSLNVYTTTSREREWERYIVLGREEQDKAAERK